MASKKAPPVGEEGADQTDPPAPSEDADAAAPDIKGHIGRALKQLYDGVASEPIPERFMDILNRLDIKPNER